MAAVDRISELPEPILHHILSFLSQKEAIQTSALSKTWRHVGPTRPKIEFRESCFKKLGRASFLSFLHKTLQRYRHRNLPVHEFIFEMSSSKLNHRAIDSKFTINQLMDLEKTLFKGLKRLSLSNLAAYIKDEESWEKIMSSCPAIEYLLVSGYVLLTTIPLTIFQAEFLAELHLTGCKLIATADQLLLIKRLKTLSLVEVDIAEETLEKIMCDCPLIERLLLRKCVGLTNIQLINNNLKHFTGYFYQVDTQSFEIDASTIETIRILNCPNWYGHDKYFFPRLKTLYLNKVKLSAELFESFSSNFPSLEDLQLVYCYGLDEIQLTVSSIKRLAITNDSKYPKPIRATIYAPNIRHFKFSGYYPPQLIFCSETTREWKSHVNMWFNNWLGNQDLNLPWLLQLRELLNSIRDSQISLEVHYIYQIKNLKVEDSNDAVFCRPVPLEHVHVKEGYAPSSFPDLVNRLFLICRPRYIGMDLYDVKKLSTLKKDKNKLDEFIKFETIQNEGEMSRGYLWKRDLEEISLQVWDQNSQEWHTVGVEGTSFHGFKPSYTQVRYSVKWRD